jgi:hypothetical protein
VQPKRRQGFFGPEDAPAASRRVFFLWETRTILVLDNGF